MSHEHHTGREEAQGSSDRSFGFVFSVFFLIVALFPLFSGGSVRIWAMIVCGIFLSVSLMAPFLLAPLNKLWMRFGLLLHHIVSPVVLGILFYLFVTPMGLVMRLFGKDFLHLRFDSSARSYWVERNPPGPKPDSLNNQF